MEVAGLVLGALPIAIQALKTSISIASSLRSAREDLKVMQLVLETEQQILQNTIQTLLKDIVPNSQLDAMITDPFGAAWNNYDEEIDTLLHLSSSAFRRTADGMRKAVDELREKLAANGKFEVRISKRKRIPTICLTSLTLTLAKVDRSRLYA